MSTPDVLFLVARILIGGGFIFSAFGMARNVPFVISFLSGRGVPVPRFVALSGITIETVLGGLMLAGVYVPYVASALAAFVVAATVMCHAFWKFSGAERAMEINHFVSNTIMVGALIGLAAATL